MATYKKRGAKKTKTSQHNPEVDRTEEVFSNLDTGASRIENWIANYQSQIIGLIVGIIVVVLAYLVYQNLVVAPKVAEANTEIYFAPRLLPKGICQ